MKEWGSELWDRFEHVVSHNRKVFFYTIFEENGPLITNTNQKKSKLDTQIVYWFAIIKITGPKRPYGSVWGGGLNGRKIFFLCK